MYLSDARPLAGVEHDYVDSLTARLKRLNLSSSCQLGDEGYTPW